MDHFPLSTYFSPLLAFSGFSAFSGLPPPDLLGRSTEWMFGSTPPWAIVTPAKSFPSSSSFLIANWICRGIIRLFLLSRLAFPASSSTWIKKNQKQIQITLIVFHKIWNKPVSPRPNTNNLDDQRRETSSATKRLRNKQRSIIWKRW